MSHRPFAEKTPRRLATPARRIDVQGARTLTLNIVTSFPEGRAAREDGIPLTPGDPGDRERLLETSPCFKAPYGVETDPAQGPNASLRSFLKH